MEAVISTEKALFTFIWRIENFTQCVLHKGEILKSPMFIVDSLEKTAWRIYVYPRGNIDGKYLNMYLFREDSGPEKITLIYELSFLTTNDQPHMIGKFQEGNISKGETLGIVNYPTLDEVFETKRSTFLPTHSPFHDTLTIRCRLWDIEETFEEPIHCSVHTRIGIEQKFFLWHIPNFSCLQIGDKKRTTISSPWDFYDTISAEVILSGTKMNNAYVDIRMTKENFNAKKFSSCKLSLLGRSGKPVIFKHYGNWGTNLEWMGLRSYFPKFLRRQELIENKSDYLPGDVLSLKFELSFTHIIQVEESQSSNYGVDFTEKGLVSHQLANTSTTLPLEGDDHLVSLQENLLSLYREGTFIDFELRTTDQAFCVHKSVLSVQSPVFKAMFISDTENNKYLNVSDVDADTLDLMLSFAYAGIFRDLQWKSAAKLYSAAAKYEIASLMKKCSSFLIFNMNISNVSDILVLADKHGDEDLETSLYDFILSLESEVMLSKEWMEFVREEAQLAAKTMHILSMKRLKTDPRMRRSIYTD